MKAVVCFDVALCGLVDTNIPGELTGCIIRVITDAS
jgi:hypothetical protein